MKGLLSNTQLLLIALQQKINATLLQGARRI